VLRGHAVPIRVIVLLDEQMQRMGRPPLWQLSHLRMLPRLMVHSLPQWTTYSDAKQG
jgi:hypothetical protein